MPHPPAPGSTEIRTIGAGTAGSGPLELYRATYDANGSRRIADRDLGTITFEGTGVRLVVPTVGIDGILPDVDTAVAVAADALGTAGGAA